MKNKKNILVTGCAGFIGFHLCSALLKSKKFNVYGIDNLNNYYSTKLKNDRLNLLKKNTKNFNFYKIDISNLSKMELLFKKIKFSIVINLAAQAGVRYSIKKPETYFKSNLSGFFNILNLVKEYKISHLLFASTSSVYGDNKKFPLNEIYNTDKPLSFYAASKKCNEVMAYSYSSIYGIAITGMRFFTVYGPMGRPDMSLYKFTKSITENKAIKLFNNGNHVRDFTYIDDVVATIIKLINKKPKNDIPYQVLNVCSSKPTKLIKFVEQIEKNLNIKSIKKLKPIQIGDVHKTHGSNKKLLNLINYKPSTDIKIGIKKFIKWYKDYFHI